MIERLPEHYKVPATARALTLPSAILLAGVGASAAILGGLPIIAAAGIGAAAWAARVAFALPRRAKPDDIDPFRLVDPWRTLVRDALAAQRSFTRSVEDTRPGPMRDRLTELGTRVGDAVRECWRIAQRGQELDRAARKLDVTATMRELEQVRADLKRHPGRQELVGAVNAIESQLASYQRLTGVAQNARDRLRRLNAQLDEVHSRAVELSVSQADVAVLQPLGSDVETMVGDLEALRQALEESAGGAPPGLATSQG